MLPWHKHPIPRPKAARAFDKKALELRGDKAMLNFEDREAGFAKVRAARAFYEQNNIRCWSEAIVPNFVTSNAVRVPEGLRAATACVAMAARE